MCGTIRVRARHPRKAPKGSKNVATLLEKELKQRVVVTENGRRRSITKQEAMLKHLVNKAISGDRRLMQLLLVEMRHLETQAALSSSGKEVLDEADREVMRQLKSRMQHLMQEGEK